MDDNGYTYVMGFYKQDGSALGRVVLTPDWGPAREWARFSALRSGRVSAGESGAADGIEPLWDPDIGEPRVAGFRVGDRSVVFSTDYFRGTAEDMSAYFVKKGDLQSDEVCQYAVFAVPRENVETASDSSRRFTVKKKTPPLKLHEGSLVDFTRRAVPCGEMQDDDCPVFIPRRVLEEASVLTRQAGTQETGGVLIGHLHQDATIPEVFVEVTAQIPATHVKSEITRLTFTEKTWTAARAAIDLRAKDEIMVGWWHSHSFLKEKCADCEKRKDNTCNSTATFMSADDCVLHRAVFSGGAYPVALVMSDSPCTGLTWALFGWRMGVIQERGFYEMGESNHETK